MSEYVHLIGAEEVGRAARNMQEAADQMTKAAASFEFIVAGLVLALEEHAGRIEYAMQGQDTSKGILPRSGTPVRCFGGACRFG